MAKERTDSKDFKTAALILDVVDYQAAESLESLIGISLTTANSKKNYSDANNALTTQKK